MSQDLPPLVVPLVESQSHLEYPEEPEVGNFSDYYRDMIPNS